MNKKLVDFLFVAIFFAISTLNVVFFIHSPTLAIIIYLIPVMYFIYRNPKVIKRSIYFLILVAISQETFYYFTDINLGWSTVSEYPVIIPGIVVEEIMFAILWPLAAIVLYHVFLKSAKDGNPKIPRSAYIFLLIYIATFFVLEFSGFTKAVGYAYLIYGTLTVIFPIAYGLFRKVKLDVELAKNIFIIGFLFFIASMIWEITALSVGWWKFYGKYISVFAVLGFNIPVEEVIIWMVFGIPVLIYLYEAVKK